MARGAEQQQNLLISKGQQLLNNAQNAYGSAYGGYQDVLKNPGYSAADKAAITSATLDPIGSTYSSATQDLYNRTARTRNDATVTAAADDLARAKAEEMSRASGGLTKSFADTALSERDRALAGLQGLYSPSVSGAGNLYSDSTRAMIARPSVLQNIAGIAGIIGGLGSAGAGAYNAVATAAHGGKVRKKQPVIVGEEGPELFVPNKDGEIIPNAYSRRAA